MNLRLSFGLLILLSINVEVGGKGLVDNAKAPGAGWERISPPNFVPVWMEPRPWWRRKERVVKRIREEREVVVSVVTENSTPSSMLNEGIPQTWQLRMSGAGQMKAPGAFAFARIREFHRLQEVSPYVLESKFEEKRGRLFLHLLAFSYHARMLMEISFQEKSHPESGAGKDVLATKSRQIFFHILEGTLRGMKGVVAVQDQDQLATSGPHLARKGSEFESELSLMAFYDYSTLPIPRLFVEFGLEVILKQIAQKMRTMVETLYQSGEGKKGH